MFHRDFKFGSSLSAANFSPLQGQIWGPRALELWTYLSSLTQGLPNKGRRRGSAFRACVLCACLSNINSKHQAPDLQERR